MLATSFEFFRVGTLCLSILLMTTMRYVGDLKSGSVTNKTNFAFMIIGSKEESLKYP